MELLPPLPVLEAWRKEGLSPQEVYAKCQDYYVIWRQAKLQPRRMFGKRESPASDKLPPLDKLKELNKVHTLCEIAEMHGVSITTVHRQVKQINNRVKHRGRLTDRDHARIRQMRETGASVDDIAAEVGIATSYCRKMLQKMGFKSKRQLKPIGCPKCKSNEYARGLCKACYSRKRYQEKIKVNE